MSLRWRAVLYTVLNLAVLVVVAWLVDRENTAIYELVHRQLNETAEHQKTHDLQVALLRETTAAERFLFGRTEHDRETCRQAAARVDEALAQLRKDPGARDAAGGYRDIQATHARYWKELSEVLDVPPPPGDETEQTAARVQERLFELIHSLTDLTTVDERRMATLGVTLREGLRGFRRSIFIFMAALGLLALVTALSLSSILAGAASNLDSGMKSIGSGDLRVRLETGGRRWLLGLPAELRAIYRCFDEMAVRLTASEEMRSQFLSMVTHDLRSPVASCLLHLDALESPEVSPEDRALSLAMMRRSLRRLQRLAESLLELMRMEGGGVRLLAETVDLNQLVRSVHDELRIQAQELGLDFTLQLPPQPATILADPEKLHSVVVNLATNAIKFTPSGGRATIRVAAEVGGMCITVEDSGPGIPEVERSALFTKFSRVGASQRLARGAGLGLFIAHAFTVAHGGRLWLEPEGRPGCTFHVWLPASPPGGIL